MKKVVGISLVVSFVCIAGYRFYLGAESETQVYDRVNTGQWQPKTDKPQEFYKLYKDLTFKEGKQAYQSGYKVRELEKALTNQSLQESRKAALSFDERGPSNVPGRTRDLFLDPGDATHKTWLAGTVGGGIWKTTDGGESWTNKTPDFPNLATTSLAYSESNPDIIYAGTGEGWLGSAGFIGGSGIFKSLDRGETWTYLTSTNSKNFEIINRLIVDPNDPNTILALTNNDPLFGTVFFSYILKSTDGGATWRVVYEGTNFVQHIVADPENFNTLYATIRGFGVIKSIDKGESWVNKSNGLNPNGRLEIAVSPVDSDRLFASVEGNITFQREDGGDGSDIYVSSDAGESWTVLFERTDKNIDYFNSQGWYDNAILAHPFDRNVVYVGGVGIFKAIVNDTISETEPTFLGAVEDDTEFMSLTNFNSGIYYGNRIAVGATDASKFTSIEIRFGPGMAQKAHRFTVPQGQGPGVPPGSYAYQDFVDVPFEVWDIGAEPDRQLMVAFRDQQRDGKFNLILTNTTEGQEDNQSREYLYISSETYSESGPNSEMAKAGGHEYENMYFLWPFLTEGYTWDEANLPDSKFVINWGALRKQQFEVSSVADVYGFLDNKNAFSQNAGETEVSGVHPDIHGIRSIIHDQSAKTWQMVISNDGGVYVSDVSTDPGSTNGSILFAGNSLNTTQFYAVDKMPGADRYIGGSQDNGTWMTNFDETSDAGSKYIRALGGDGFGTVWHSQNPQLLLGSLYNLIIYKSVDGGANWTEITGITDETPFITKLENSHSKPDVVFTAGESGVWRSENFGGAWKLAPIAENWSLSSSFHSIEISEASPDVVWAGSRMDDAGLIHVSTDNGKTFAPTTLYDEVELGVVSGIASHPVDFKTAYALFSYSESPKILRTQDLGQTWEDISGFSPSSTSTGFPDVAVLELVVMPHDPSIIWAGTEIGIFESTDNGATWHILDSNLPRVSIWDMNFNEDQLVIGTHGRGIWSYTLPETPEVIVAPVVTSVEKNLSGNQFRVAVEVTSQFDSIQFLANGVASETLSNPLTGSSEVLLSGSFTGTKILFSLIGYKSGSPFSSDVYEFANFAFLETLESYVDDFNTDNQKFLGNMSIKNQVGFSTRAMQTPHDYAVSTEYTYMLKHPIEVASSDAIITYKDIAIVEPGADGAVFGDEDFNDYVVVEGSLDGLTWTPLADGYNAAADSDWLNLFNSGGDATENLFVEHSINLLDEFDAGDDVLIRFRMSSNSEVTGWGWIVEDLVIQTEILGLGKDEVHISVFPNPSVDELRLTNSQSIQSLRIVGLDGRVVVDIEGQVSDRVNVSALSSGLYVVELSLKDRTRKTLKFIKK